MLAASGPSRRLEREELLAHRHDRPPARHGVDHAAVDRRTQNGPPAVGVRDARQRVPLLDLGVEVRLERRHAPGHGRLHHAQAVAALKDPAARHGLAHRAEEAPRHREAHEHEQRGEHDPDARTDQGEKPVELVGRHLAALGGCRGLGAHCASPLSGSVLAPVSRNSPTLPSSQRSRPLARSKASASPPPSAQPPMPIAVAAR